ncbi:cell wall hydrolase [uncultured Erythrobacter sp.]|uniref:cell wall hydrolase n=1 Tax=uncultured Erythrobacter sp. TaxID=263913 RepID=UPI002635E579|nr:cell wall hydrolase [uncultured Erythrobacter sp.]
MTVSRKTYSYSAVAVAAIAGLSFSSADGAQAFAQDLIAEGEVAESGAEPVEVETVEIVPQAASEKEITFVTNEVVQPVAGPASPTPGDSASLGELVSSMDKDTDLTEQMRCLAGAVYFEARGEPLAGQLAVAEVVINRSQDSRWPASYCGVVYQRAQFSFVRGGRMPSINTSKATWRRAKAVAQIAHDNLWQSEASNAVYFHANYVRPSWSRKKTRVATIDTHVFYR